MWLIGGRVPNTSVASVTRDCDMLILQVVLGILVFARLLWLMVLDLFDFEKVLWCSDGCGFALLGCHDWTGWHDWTDFAPSVATCARCGGPWPQRPGVLPPGVP